MRPCVLIAVLAAGSRIGVGYATDHAHRQAAQPATAFKAASIVPNRSGGGRGGCCRLDAGGRVTATNATLRQLVQAAYQKSGFDRREIEGGPQWMDTDRFDVAAEAPEEHVFDAEARPVQTWSMLRNLLADRFKLKLHVENRTRPVYLLLSAETQPGPRLHRAELGCADVMQAMVKGIKPEKLACTTASYPGRLVVNGLTMTMVASLLSAVLNRPVIDRTNLTGSFDAEVEAVDIRPPGPFGPSYRPSDTKQSIFDALPQQLGLKLQEAQGTVDVIVIDHAERPAPPGDR